MHLSPLGSLIAVIVLVALIFFNDREERQDQ